MVPPRPAAVVKSYLSPKCLQGPPALPGRPCRIKQHPAAKTCPLEQARDSSRAQQKRLAQGRSPLGDHLSVKAVMTLLENEKAQLVVITGDVSIHQADGLPAHPVPQDGGLYGITNGKARLAQRKMCIPLPPYPLTQKTKGQRQRWKPSGPIKRIN